MSAGSIPVKLSPGYDHLTHLDIGVFDSKETLAALCILRSSPNLKELKIEVSFISGVVIRDFDLVMV